MDLAERSGRAHELRNRAAGAVIKKLFGVSYDPSQVGRMLTKLGWSRQKPQRKASQQEPQADAQWREEQLPKLNRIAEAKKRRMRVGLYYMWMSRPVIYYLY